MEDSSHRTHGRRQLEQLGQSPIGRFHSRSEEERNKQQFSKRIGFKRRLTIHTEDLSAYHAVSATSPSYDVFSLPCVSLQAITHMMSSKDPATTIDPVMTSSLVVYSILFMRWAIAVTPANYPLLVCHICNEIAQLAQLGRWANAT